MDNNMSEMRQSHHHHPVSNETSLVEKEATGTVRRKLERFRSKLIELFFTSSASPSHSPPLTPVSPPPTMSNYYFGYTTTGRMNFDATSTASSLTSDDSNSSSSSSSSSASLPTCERALATGPAYNPFLDSDLTSRSIHLNASDLDTLKGQFEPYLGTIDDQDNFFDPEFMSAYIAYTLVTRLREHSSLELRQAGLASTNLAREIAREIFAQSECEPCGLKGCRINVILESLDHDSGDDNNDESCSRVLLDRFRFDSTCLLTTFELNLVLKQVPFGRVDVNNNSQTNSTSRRNSSQAIKSVRFATTNHRSPVNCPNQVFLDDTQFHLYKCSLY